MICAQCGKPGAEPVTICAVHYVRCEACLIGRLTGELVAHMRQAADGALASIDHLHRCAAECRDRALEEGKPAAAEALAGWMAQHATASTAHADFLRWMAAQAPATFDDGQRIGDEIIARTEAYGAAAKRFIQALFEIVNAHQIEFDGYLVVSDHTSPAAMLAATLAKRKGAPA